MEGLKIKLRDVGAAAKGAHAEAQGRLGLGRHAGA